MPLVTITIQAPKSPEFKRKALDAVHAALVSVGVPEADRFQRVLELAPDGGGFAAIAPELRQSSPITRTPPRPPRRPHHDRVRHPPRPRRAGRTRRVA